MLPFVYVHSNQHGTVFNSLTRVLHIFLPPRHAYTNNAWNTVMITVSITVQSLVSCENIKYGVRALCSELTCACAQVCSELSCACAQVPSAFFTTHKLSVLLYSATRHAHSCAMLVACRAACMVTLVSFAGGCAFLYTQHVGNACVAKAIVCLSTQSHVLANLFAGRKAAFQHVVPHML